MRARFSAGRCCCGPVGNARIIPRDVTIGLLNKAGTIAVYANGGASLGVYDLTTDWTTTGTPYIPVPLPATPMPNSRIVLDLPRCVQHDTGYTVNLTTSAASTRTFKISAPNDNQTPGATPVAVASGYCAVTNIRYPQVSTLKLTDSVLGDADLIYSPSITGGGGAVLGGWRGSIGVDILGINPNDPLGPLVPLPGEIVYTLTGPSSAGAYIDVLHLTASRQYKPPGGGPFTGSGWTTGPVISQSVWSPDVGGGVTYKQTVQAGHPWVGNPNDTTNVTIEVFEL